MIYSVKGFEENFGINRERMKALVGIAIALAIFRTGESVSEVDFSRNFSFFRFRV